MTLLPPSISFERSAIIVNTPPQRISPSIPTTSAVSPDALAAKEPKEPPKRAIYGSVKTADIVFAMKEILAEDDEGKRVVLLPENVSFVDSTEEQDRVKQLGLFDIDVKIDGAEAIRRTIEVKAQS